MGAAKGADNADYMKQQTRLQAVCYFIYNPEEGTVLGRTALSWCQIFVFYVVFYSFLAACFAICLTVFIDTLGNSNVPKYYGPGTLLGSPGLGFQPWMQSAKDPSLISFNSSQPSSYADYVQKIESFMQRYVNTSGTRSCNANQTNGDAGQLPCRFDPRLLLMTNDSRCTEANSFGFATGHPCILITVNKIIGWVPQPFSNGTVPPDVMSRYDDGFITLNCTGKYPSDTRNLGDVAYVPETGIDASYFPYLNLPGYNYQQPFAFVKFMNLTPGVTVQVECYGFAANMAQDASDGLGSVSFQLRRQLHGAEIYEEYRKTSLSPQAAANLSSSSNNSSFSSNGSFPSSVTTNGTTAIPLVLGGGISSTPISTSFSSAILSSTMSSSINNPTSTLTTTPSANVIALLADAARNASNNSL